jgi:hypothetical protein
MPIRLQTPCADAGTQMHCCKNQGPPGVMMRAAILVFLRKLQGQRFYTIWQGRKQWDFAGWQKISDK